MAIVRLIDRTIAFIYCRYPSSEGGDFKCYKSQYNVGQNKTIIIGMRVIFLPSVEYWGTASKLSYSATSTISQFHIIITKTPFHMHPKYLLYPSCAIAMQKQNKKGKGIMKIIIQG